MNNSFPASGNFCRLLITFANSLDPDQARQNVGPDVDPNCLTLKNPQMTKKKKKKKKHAKLPNVQRVKGALTPHQGVPGTLISKLLMENPV